MRASGPLDTVFDHPLATTRCLTVVEHLLGSNMLEQRPFTAVTLLDLSRLRRSAVSAVPNAGAKTLATLDAMLADAGLEWAAEPPPFTRRGSR